MIVATLAAMIAFVGLSFGALAYLPPLLAEEVASYPSPDGACRIVVYRNPRLFAMPGQGSDAPGRVDLVTKDGSVVQSRKLEMVQLASKPIWKDGRVSMKLLFDWKMQSPSDR